MRVSLNSSIAGRYELKQLLGKGGMGAIYLAHDALIDRLVALKLLHTEIASEDLRRRFAQEARASGALTHPNIVTVHDYGEVDGAPFIVMEYVRGETLAEVIKRRAQLAIVQKLRWMEQVCLALEYAHGRGIIHRDIKPSNLMVDEHGIVKVLDFGVARIVGAGITKMSMVIGTPGYMSPEQIEGGSIDARSDVFSVGAVLYELLCFREAFVGDTPHAIMNRVVREEPASLERLLPGISPSILSVVQKSMRKNAAQRFADMAAFREGLSQARQEVEGERSEPTALLPDRGRVPPATPHTPRRRTDPAPRRRTDPVEIAKRRAEQIDQRLKQAHAAFEAGDYDAAALACEAVLLLDPTNWSALGLISRLKDQQASGFHTLLGQARSALAKGDLLAAEQLAAQAASLEPNADDVHTLETEIQNERQAQDREVRRQRDLDAAFTKAHHSLQQGALDAAERYVTEALVFDPSHQASIELSGRIRKLRGDAGSRPSRPAVAPAKTPRRVVRRSSLLIPAVAAAAAVLLVGIIVVVSNMSAPSPAAPASPNRATQTPAQGPVPPPAKGTQQPTVEVNEPRPVASAESSAPGATSRRTEPATNRPPTKSVAMSPSANEVSSGSPLPGGVVRQPPTLALAMASEAEQAGDLEKALRFYRQALDIDPVNQEAVAGLGRVEAERTANMESLIKRASNLFLAGDLDGALRDVEQALRIDPQNAAALDLRTRVQRAKGGVERRPPPR